MLVFLFRERCCVEASEPPLQLSIKSMFKEGSKHMFFNVFIQALAEVNITFLIEFLAALITVPVIIAIVVVLFRLLVMIIVLLITSIRKLQKKANKHDEVAEE